ncbi:MAG: hypothetical protein LBR82_00285 [Desulfovibrio sp.]|jgi:hypothetical protein|nr:hypothetical protein [Desulfovibrio sp.]
MDQPNESLLAQIEVAKENKLTIGSILNDREMGRTLGWSPALVADNRDEADNEIKRRMIASNDLFASWAKQSRVNTAIALEDMNNMLPAFDVLQAEKERQAMLTTSEKLGTSFERGAAQTYQAMLGFGELVMENFGTEGLLRMMMPDSVVDDFSGTTVDVSAQKQSGIQAAPNQDRLARTELTRLRRDSAAAMPAPLLDGGFLYDVVESVPQRLMQILGAAAGTAVAGPVGGVAGSMGVMFPQIAGGQYGNLRDEGISPGNAAQAGLINAGIQSLLETLSLKKFFDVFRATGWTAIGKATAMSMATEFATEFVQKYPEVATDLIARTKERGGGDWVRQFWDRLSQTHKEGAYEGAIGAIWGITGGAGRLAYERAHEARAADFRKRMTGLYEWFSKTAVHQQAPDIAQALLQQNGMNGDVYVDAREALRLYHSAALDLEALDVTEDQLSAAAAMGQDVPVKAARLVAHVRDKGTFDNLIGITRDVPYAETVAEIEREGRKQEDIDRIVDTMNAQVAHEQEVEKELARIEAEIVAATAETDTLQHQLVTKADSLKSTDAAKAQEYAKTHVGLIAAYARRHSLNPDAQLDFLRKLSFLGPEGAARERSWREAQASGRFAGDENLDGDDFSLPDDIEPLPDLNELGEQFTPEEFEAMQAEEAQMAALGIKRNMSEVQKLRLALPWLGHIWGRLDGASLRETWPDAFKEIFRNYGGGVFRSAERGGQAIDVLADELVRVHIFEDGMGADELVEKLKTPKSEQRWLYQFAGEGSAMSDTVRAGLSEAVALAEQGTDNEAIRQQTGWFKGMDGKWRYEIPDNLDGIHIPTIKGKAKAFTLGQLYDNPKLYESYPQIEGMRVLLQPISSTVGGYYSHKHNSISISSNLPASKKEKVLMHEIQHAIQHIEGFARGGNVGQFQDKPEVSTEITKLNNLLSALRERHPAIEDTFKKIEKLDEQTDGLAEDDEAADAIYEEIDALEQFGKETFGADWNVYMQAKDDLALAEVGDGSAYSQYERLAGEIEAFDTTDRAGMSDSERAAQAPNLREDAIVVFGSEPAYSIRTKPAPQKTKTAYKLFRTRKDKPGKLFPLFVDANEEIEIGVWLDAEVGPAAGEGKVKSKLGPLAMRPGWHAGDLPVATHIGSKANPNDTAPSFRADDQVWAEVEVADDVDWQAEADRRAKRGKGGEKIPRTAHIVDQVPEDGMYRYKTNANMTGNWIISGAMRVKRILSDAEVAGINAEHSVADLPRRGSPDNAIVLFGGEQVAAMPVESKGRETYLQTAYTGSPTRGIKRMSTDFIGTGEGAQAYGWGLYSAELRDIAEYYRKNVHADSFLVDGKPVERPTSYELWAYRAASDGVLDKYITMLKREVDRQTSNKDRRSAESAKENLEFALSLKGKNVQYQEGQLYKLEIPDNDELLDYDKPLSKQPPKIKKILKGIKKFLPESALEDLGGDWNPLFSPENTGREFYDTLTSIVGGDKQASLLLNKLGIPGLRYLDEKSRIRGGGTHNFVIWNDEAIQIMETYYQAKEAGRGKGKGKGKDSPFGAVEITPDKYTVILGKGANLSTLIHETGHIFEHELRRIVASGMADEQQIADLQKLDEWLGRFDDTATLKEEYDKRVRRQYFGGKKFEKLSAAELEDARNIAKREYFARGFEAYMREGKAPAEGLRGLFERFKRWLLAVYKHAKALGVKITPEITGVFDRMLATEMEMDETAAVNELFAKSKAELDNLNVPVADRAHMNGLLDLAKQEAIAGVERERKRNKNALIRQWTAEARAELMKDPVYIARAELRKPGQHLNAPALIELLGEGAAQAVRQSVGPHAVRVEGGHDPELFAAAHGYADAAAMVAAITGVQPMGRRISEIVAAREMNHDAEVDPAPYLLRTEAAKQAIEETGKYLAAALGKSTMDDAAFVALAKEKLAAMPMREAAAYRVFVGAMRRALKRERAASAKGDFAAAYEANVQARLNLEFVRQSLDISDAVQTLEKQASRYIKQAKADPAARYAVMVLASRYDIAPFVEPLAGGKSFDTIKDWYKARADEGYMIEIDEEMFLGEKMPWKDMSYAEFGDVFDEITRIVTVERNMRKLLTTANKAELKETIEQLNGSILQYHKDKGIKLLESQGVLSRAVDKTVSVHTKMEVFCRILDGGNPLGYAWTYLYKPINMAEDKRGMYLKQLLERLQGSELFGMYSFSELEDMGKKKEFVQSVNESITKGQRIMFALNMGNESNLIRLEKGFKYNEQQRADIIMPLTERDWKFVQAIWDTFEQYKEEAFRIHEEVTGKRPTEIEAKPFTVRTSDGKQLTLRGGYFPTMYAKEFADPKIEESIENVLQGKPAFAASTRKGHLMERQGSGAQSPLKLDLTSIPRALDDVVTDICFRKALIDVGRIMRNPAFRDTIHRTFGTEYYDMMKNWLRDAARINTAPSPGQSMARWARSSTSIMSMGLKVTTLLVQPFGLTQSIDQIGSAAVAQGISEAYGQGAHKAKEKVDEIRSLSSFMDNRMKTYDRDVYDATSAFAKDQLTPTGLLDSVTPNKVKELERWVKKHAFVPMAGVQFYSVDVPTWLGAFNKYMKEHQQATKEQAVDYADHIVRITQGTGLNKDLSQIQRGSEWLKLLTMFYSYFNALFGMIQMRTYDVKQHQNKDAALRAANSFLLLVAVPALLSELVAGRGPDEDEDYWKWATRMMIMYPAQAIIGLRDIAQFVDPKYGYSATPAEDAPASIYNSLAEVVKIAGDPDKFDAKKLAKKAMRTYGYMKGLPLKQFEITLFNTIDYLDGTSPDYELRDLVFTRQPSRR